MHTFEMSAISLLYKYELFRYETAYRRHADLPEVIQDELIEVLFPLRQFCWPFARRQIEDQMGWSFDFLDHGIQLGEHASFLAGIENLDFPDDEWMSLLISISGGDFHGWEDGPYELAEVANEAVKLGISSENLGGLIHGAYKNFDRPLTSEDLSQLLEAGYRNRQDVDLFDSPDFERSLFEWVVHPRELLEKIPGGLSGFMQFEDILRGVCPEDSIDFDKEYVERLFETGLSADEISSILVELIDVGHAHDVGDEIVDELTQRVSIDFVGDFSQSAISLRNISLPISIENLIKYWCLKSDVILFLIDNGLLADEFLGLAQTLNDASTIQEWIDQLINFESIEEVKAWVDAGFSPQESNSWKSSGFSPKEASKWLCLTADPVIARRRSDAGIYLDS